ncbi:Palmitoyltransferase [Spironucleus salmonicida]|uniref:Palmitoyltransferase n=1 Tax=Spironucleus salmonicida TaxID=348837 RepID=V6LZD9_9EUKA|nr:Palmitoyltransferase [Spironucleus salmonicida]|eukprot:EST46179.1 DHHC zinc finger and transmembrane domain-containing protein [Spironucleus salmonicida]
MTINKQQIISLKMSKMEKYAISAVSLLFVTTPNIMKLGNLHIFLNGQIVIGAKFQQAIYSMIGLLSPVLISIFSWAFLYNIQDASNIFIYRGACEAFITITCILCVFALFSVFITAFTDPGIIPGKELLESFTATLNEKIQSKSNTIRALPQTQKDLKISSNCQSQLPSESSMTLTILSSLHKPETPLKFQLKGYSFNSKYCSTCRFYRPLRATHASISNVCIQRYDHFCAWIGTDVALHNHGLFYLMLFIVFIQLSVMILINLTIIIYSIQAFVNIDVIPANLKGLGIFGMIMMLTLLGGAGYIIFSLCQLMQYHVNLLKTGTLTKEDSGVNNAQVSGPFSYFNLWLNFKLCFKGLTQKRLLKNAIIQQNYIINLVEKNPYIVNLDSLGRILLMNGYQQFMSTNIALSEEDQVKAQSFKHFYDESQQKNQLINNQLTYLQILTIRDGVEFGLLRSRDQVIQTKEDFDSIKDTRPDLFVEKESKRDMLSLVKVCQKKIKDNGRVDQKQEIAVAQI